MGELGDSPLSLIRHGREERRLEFKESVDWSNREDREKLVKAILAMSNVRDGGTIIIGVRDNGERVGLDDKTAAKLRHDVVSPVVDEFAEPYVRFTATPVLDEQGRRFVVIKVEEFVEYPVVCKKDGKTLKRGALYTRGHGKHETKQVSSVAEMKEILDMALEKALRSFFARMLKAGLLLPAGPTDAQRFREELGDL